MARLFRILMIEDRSFEHIVEVIDGASPGMPRLTLTELLTETGTFHARLFEELHERCHSTAGMECELFIAGNVEIDSLLGYGRLYVSDEAGQPQRADSRPGHIVEHPLTHDFLDLTKREDRLSFLSTVDVLLLDIGGLKNLPPYWKLDPSDVPGASVDDLRPLNTDLSGAGFLLKFRQRLAHARIVVLSALKASAVLQRFLFPLITAEPFDPRAAWVTKFEVTERDRERVVRLVASIYDCYRKGRDLRAVWPSIEFAALHDDPVLIVGETGSGKELIARTIHNRWCEEKVRAAEGATKLPRAQLEARVEELQESSWCIVNCAGLRGELARSELFGHVKGSFTGADEHSIGLILSACGLKPHRARPVKHEMKLDEVGRLVDQALAGLKRYDRATAPEDKTKIALEILPDLRHLVFTDDGRLRSFLRLIQDEIQRGRAGQERWTDFQSMVVSAGTDALGSGKVKKKGMDVEFAGNGPFGTLFLDEFGDLPPDVQTIFLRYLEGFECQPVGYPGRIRGARTRVIAATSDPRVARFVGETLRGSWRYRSELERPLRMDLLFRVHGQRIRTEEITTENAEAKIDWVLANHSADWQPEAKKELVKLVCDQIDAVSRAEKTQGEGQPWVPVFGHWRQLDKIARLADAYARSASQRGQRAGMSGRSEAAIDKTVVEWLWSPGTLPSPFPVREKEQSSSGVDGTLSVKVGALVDQAVRTISENPLNLATLVAGAEDAAGLILACGAEKFFEAKKDAHPNQQWRIPDGPRYAAFCTLVAIAWVLNESAQPPNKAQYFWNDRGDRGDERTVNKIICRAIASLGGDEKDWLGLRDFSPDKRGPWRSINIVEVWVTFLKNDADVFLTYILKKAGRPPETSATALRCVGALTTGLQSLKDALSARGTARLRTVTEDPRGSAK